MIVAADTKRFLTQRQVPKVRCQRVITYPTSAASHMVTLFLVSGC
jgi:hypothetical protein